MEEKLDEAKAVDDFLQQKQSDEDALIMAFAQEIIKKQIHKKEIDEDIKEIKADAKSNGVPVAKVMKVISDLKKIRKSTKSDLNEEEIIMDKIANDSHIVKLMFDLIS